MSDSTMKCLSYDCNNERVRGYYCETCRATTMGESDPFAIPEPPMVTDSSCYGNCLQTGRACAKCYAKQARASTQRHELAMESQVGGNHYSKLAIQPIEYIYKNNIPFPEGSVIKYVTRWRDKGGIKDLQKAKHFIELLIELENGNVGKAD